MGSRRLADGVQCLLEPLECYALISVHGVHGLFDGRLDAGDLFELFVGGLG